MRNYSIFPDYGAKRDLARMSETVIQNKANVPDIDYIEKKDPLFMSDYAKEIFKYFKEEESKTTLPADFLKGQQFIKSAMRRKLVDWLSEVSSLLGLLTETYHLIIYIIDKYLSLNKRVGKGEFQLVGVAAILIASKYEEYSYVVISDLITLTGGTYTAEMIKEKEVDILNTLDFLIIRPTTLDFLRRFSRAFENDIKCHFLAKYILESATLDEKLMEVPVSRLAAAAVYLARRMCGIQPYWNDTVSYYSEYNLRDIIPTAIQLNCLMMFVKSPECLQTKIREKYLDKKYQEVSLVPPVVFTSEEINASNS
ncbi:G2/mitotic-specific cyclin-B, putative [Entamoeba invadens IP1]|uniref:G2/mitotic-specific cyclin-B, putative n=1 Tax=Entamoeba invadens IP1 TaxID=370355 RepID=A0A0A1U1G1_ENTIV|nr:G2/mitotic-specific cyclin-B, putative [Entamoeba invadens IP1]ELP86438.1 G2/mitotic-specific cyclin-B, putative [Entamoeba invadens IP1]|eukprot:XP_004185784.1 G2/mitotic-specific cyclin-B, putative [Entamoeba invadens IP1]